MEKTWDDYMNDPDIINEPMGLRITYAMRLKVQDEKKGIPEAVYSAMASKRAEDFLASFGKTLRYDLGR